MKCPKCGSENVDVQLMQETQGKTTETISHTKSKYRQGHGCLWWLCVGWWWRAVDLMLWIFSFIPRLLIQILKPKKYRGKASTATVSTEKVNTVYRTMCLCRDCGNHWESK